MKLVYILICLICVHCIVACTIDEFNGPLPISISCDPSTTRGANRVSGVSFDHEHLLCIGIDIPSTDFQSMAQQSRFGGSSDLDIFKSIIAWNLSGCSEPDPNLFTYFEANIEIAGLVVNRVGIRKKGFLGSVIGNGRTKPSFKIKTNKYVDEQYLGRTERITLNNNNQDPTRLNTCLAYDIFTAAGYPAPQCNLANVMLGKRSLGVYTHVESIKKRFLRRVFGNDHGHLYEGTMADFTEGHLAGAVIGELGHWAAKTKDTDPNGGPLLAIAEALQHTDSELLPVLETIVNIDHFIRFWALETLIAHTDGYSAGANNFYVYFDPNDLGRATFIPWGTDAVLSREAELDQERQPGNFGAFVRGEIARRLSRLPQTASLYQKEIQRLLNEVWNESKIISKIEHFAAQVRTAELAEDYQQKLIILKDWIQQRRSVVEQKLVGQMAIGSHTNETCEEAVPGAILDLIARFAFAW